MNPDLDVILDIEVEMVSKVALSLTSYATIWSEFPDISLQSEMSDVPAGCFRLISLLKYTFPI